MSESKDATHNLNELAPGQLDMTPETALQTQAKVISASIDQARMMQTYWVGLNRYIMDFMAPAFSALESFSGAESDKLQEYAPEETIKDYMGLLEFNLRLAEKGLTHGMKAINDFLAHQLEQGSKAWHNTLYQQKGEDIAAFMAKQARLMELVVHEYPQAIRNIEPEYGFHFDDGNYIKTAETDRFCLYQVLPWNKSVKVHKKGKPVVIIPPYVLGANILSFLPGEGKSFVHCFANTGMPTYIRIVKDIYANTAVQEMTGEEDCLDTKFFLEQVKAAHHRPVTLCGYCQGGFTVAVNYLSGELDGLVDALITSVAPMDGTRSKSLSDFMAQIPKRFEDISFAMKTLPNGNRVVDGKLMSWVYKLKSMEKDNPIIAFIRDLKLFERNLKINKTAAAINYWLLYDQTDLPLEICKLSFNSYTIPVAKDGTLPVKLFGRPLNFKRAKEQGIKWLICVAEKDDLVEKESALTPTEWVDAEVAVFPKGHVAIATSWSMPATECSLDKCFLDYRGPVRFHMDLEAEADKIQTSAAQKVSRDKARLEADLKLAGEKAKAEPVAALPTAGDKIQAAAPQTVPEQKPRSVEALKAMEGKAESQDAAPAPEDPTQSAGQKAEKNTAPGAELQKPEA
jgi:poly(3-hydroxyalkanoate) synthetase